VPTANLKLLPEEAISWFGLLAPAHTAAPVIAKVHEEVVKIAAQADMRERLAQLGLEVAVNSPDEFVAVINADNRQMGEGHQGRQHQAERTEKNAVN
jgi:tripartite-type tricarboxylate transporter receptor subunit TctC